MIKTIIIEDEKAAYENLVRFLKHIDPSLEIIGWLKSVEDSIEWFKNNTTPDLVFLDIQLSDGNSFDIFKSIELSCPIIFTTAYDQFALDAFALHSIDYLLKPISKSKLEKAIKKFKTLYDRNDQPDLNQLQVLLKTLSHKVNYKDRFLVKKGDQLLSIGIDMIAYFFVDEITLLVTKEGRKFSLNNTLEKLEKEVNPKSFFRLNRKVIANINAIHQITKLSDSKLKVVLNPRQEFDIYVSKEKAKEFKAWLG